MWTKVVESGQANATSGRLSPQLERKGQRTCAIKFYAVEQSARYTALGCFLECCSCSGNGGDPQICGRKASEAFPGKLLPPGAFSKVRRVLECFVGITQPEWTKKVA
jgi:hypothetical protein